MIWLSFHGLTSSPVGLTELAINGNAFVSLLLLLIPYTINDMVLMVLSRMLAYAPRFTAHYQLHPQDHYNDIIELIQYILRCFSLHSAAYAIH
jgi:hypothetical protein